MQRPSQTPAVEDAGGARKQFHKTQLCRFYMSSTCMRGSACTYAHSADELKRSPNLRKIMLCTEWQRGTCPLRADQCRFAHGKRELRSSKMKNVAEDKQTNINDADSPEQVSLHSDAIYSATSPPPPEALSPPGLEAWHTSDQLPSKLGSHSRAPSICGSESSTETSSTRVGSSSEGSDSNGKDEHGSGSGSPDRRFYLSGSSSSSDTQTPQEELQVKYITASISLRQLEAEKVDQHQAPKVESELKWTREEFLKYKLAPQEDRQMKHLPTTMPLQQAEAENLDLVQAPQLKSEPTSARGQLLKYKQDTKPLLTERPVRYVETETVVSTVPPNLNTVAKIRNGAIAFFEPMGCPSG